MTTIGCLVMIGNITRKLHLYEMKCVVSNGHVTDDVT